MGSDDLGTQAADLEDVRRTRQGDGEACARLIERHQGTIARQMWRFTRDHGQHAELVQDVFVNAYTSLGTYRGDGPFLHWLRKIAVRTGYAYWRGKKGISSFCADRPEGPLDKRHLSPFSPRRLSPLSPELASRLADEPADHSAAEAAELVHAVLARLPPRDRLVLTLLYLEERSVAEAAALIGWSPTMVKVQAWRARGKLRRLLESRGMAEGGRRKAEW